MTKKYYLRCKGGTGNQLFQINRLLQLSHQKIEGNTIDCSAYTVQPILISLVTPETHIVSSKAKSFVYRNILKLFSPFSQYITCMKSIPCYLEGYWQDFSDTSTESQKQIYQKLCEALNPTDKVLDDIDFENSVCVHMRLGDYQSPKNRKIYRSVELDYYKKAIEYCLQGNNQKSIYLFSDEYEDARRKLQDILGSITNGPPQISTVDRMDGYTDLDEILLMSRFNNIVMANSTFSGWAAIFSSFIHECPTIVCPRSWFNDPYQKLQPSLHSSWITF
jgi:hypothetical protein